MKKILLTVFSALVFVLPAQAAYDTNARVPVVGKQIVTKNGLPSTITFKVVDTAADNSNSTTSKVIEVSRQNLIYAGNIIKIPCSNCEHEAGHAIYTVKRGDTLSEIALKYNTTVNE